MSDFAIRIDGVGKRYQLGQRESYRTLRDGISNAAANTVRRFRSAGQPKPANTYADSQDHKHIWALRDVSLDVGHGEILGVIGHNGAGKSTLLKIVSRITSPTEGRVVFRGRLGSLLEVGTGFHPELTGRENIYLNGTILGLTRADIKRRFDEIVAFSEVEDFLDTPVKRYSSGMHVRLAFAVAAHLEPDILIVDEVLAVGDAAFQSKCLGKMGDVAGEGRTILFVSHNMNAIQRLCPTSILFERGRMVASGSTRDIAGAYLSSGVSNSRPGAWIDASQMRRSGSGAVSVQELQYRSDNAETQFQPYPGGPMEVTLKVLSDAWRSINSVAIILYDKNGTKLINADTISLGRTIELAKGTTLLRITIDALYLNPGSYTLGWWLANHRAEVFDFCDSAIELDLIDNQESQFGIQPPADGAVMCTFTVDSW